MLKRVVAAVDGWQRRHALLGFPIAAVKKFTEDRGSSYAALIAYYAFFSLFPLALAFVSILGFVLDGNPELREEIVESAFARIPVIGPQLQGQVQPLTGSGVALVLGLLVALWAGLGVTVALARAFADIWDVPRMEEPNGLKARARGLAVLFILGGTLILATAAAGLAIGGRIGPAAERGATLGLSLTVNAVVLLAAFALLTPRPWSIRDLLPGVGAAVLGLLALQSLGAWYVSRAIAGASATYGTFALVIGLMSWFLLSAHVLLMAAEVNVVLRWRLWPRSLAGELEPADRLALERFAAATRRDARQRIAVSFGDPPEDER
jgi:YihY family inner membrane protein